jgi:hypothetical protein
MHLKQFFFCFNEFVGKHKGNVIICNKSVKYDPILTDSCSDPFTVIADGTTECFLGGSGVRNLKYFIKGGNLGAPAELYQRYLDLDADKRARVQSILEHKINFISGTICPADKSDGKIEDPLQALRYYHI